MTGVPVPRQKEGHRGNCDDDSDSDDEHTQPSFILKHCEELGINELKKMVVRCKICRMELLKASFFKHHRDRHYLRLKCDYCSFRCSLEEDLVSHVEVHDEELIPCKDPDCEHKFKFKCDLLAHMQLIHNALPDQLECRHCRKRFVDQNALTIHYKSHEENYPYECSECGKAYKMKASLKLHFMSHAGDRPYKCEVCGKSYNRRDKFKIHQKKHDESKAEDEGVVSATCSHFELQYDAPVTLVRCSTCGIVCRTCGMKFLSRKLSRSHTHENLCELCGRKSLHRKAHIAHQRYHASGIQFKCDSCQAGFVKALDLELHNKKQHNIPIPARGHQEEKANRVPQRSSFVCSFCNNTCNSKNALTAHIKQEHIRKFECELCERTFSTKTLLDFHVARHNGDKPHKCKQCEKAFVRKTDLYRHESTHGSGEQLACDLCGITLKSKRNLQLHLRRHEEREEKETEVTCSCGMKFIRKSHLLSHMKEVHGVEDATAEDNSTSASAPEERSVKGTRSKSDVVVIKKTDEDSPERAESKTLLRKRKPDGTEKGARNIRTKLESAHARRKTSPEA